MMRTAVALLLAGLVAGCSGLRGTGDLGIVVERATGSLLFLNTTNREITGRVEGLGDLSHASAVFSRDERHAYVFGRDGALTKVDLLEERLAGRIIQAGNSIGGAISQDGRLVAVSNYDPGGVRIFDSRTLEPIADIPTPGSKVVGLADAPGRRFVFSLYEAGEIWLVEAGDPRNPGIRRYTQVGQQPYDGQITPDGRWYVAGLFGEEGLALLDLWNPDAGVRRILPSQKREDERLPVYKMPHLEGWGVVEGHAFLPAVGRHEVVVVDTRTWTEEARIPVQGQPVFVVARPDGRHLWVNFALPDNHRLQVIDVATRRIIRTLEPGKAILHMEFTPRGEEAWVSLRDEDRVVIYDTETFEPLARLPARAPSGIFFTPRAHRFGS